MKPQRILLVDDSARDTEMTLDVFEQSHIANEVVALRDGVDGLEVLRQIKADARLKLIPVVVMTSSREEQDLVASYQLGVNGYVVKPLDFFAFVEAVKMVGAFWAVLNEPPQISRPDTAPGELI